MITKSYIFHQYVSSLKIGKNSCNILCLNQLCGTVSDIVTYTIFEINKKSQTVFKSDHILQVISFVIRL
jgi:hypothetical protein